MPLDSQITLLAQAVGDDIQGINLQLGGFSIVQISQTAYDALSPPDPNTIYLITS